MAAGSDKVILGTVGQKNSYFGNDSRTIRTSVISPDVTIDGAEEGAVVVQMAGGTVGDTTMSVSDGPEFPEGQRVIVFLKLDGDRFVVVVYARPAALLLLQPKQTARSKAHSRMPSAAPAPG